MTSASSSNGGRLSGRTAARLASAQALYQVDLTGVSAERALTEFLEHRMEEGGESGAPSNMDRRLFVRIMRGAVARLDDLDDMIQASLAENWTLARLDAVLRAILRAAAYELAAEGKTPARVVINEYVNVAHAFFEGKEPGFVNGVLDRLARVVRADEMETSSREPASDSG